MNEPARSESLDARAWWTLAVVVAVVLVAYLGLSAGLMPKAHPDDDPATTGQENGVGDRDRAPPQTDFEAGEALDPQSLRDFGELGVLPGLLDDFSNVPDCDFDDALSTCQ
jgi:hypothetical protein